MNIPGLPGYDSWLEPPDDEDEDLDDEDCVNEADTDDDEPQWGRRVEHGRTIYEEDFLYDPLRGDY